MNTEIMDKLFLELSQFTSAQTAKELQLQAELDKLRNENVNIAADLNYHKAILDGSWPTAVDILKTALREAEALKGE